MRPLESLCALLASMVIATACAAAQNADAQFEAIGKRFVDEFGRYAPVDATQLGDHRFDAELDDLRPAGRARSEAFSRQLLSELEAIDRARLSRANQVDAAVLENHLRYDLWRAQQLRLVPSRLPRTRRRISRIFSAAAYGYCSVPIRWNIARSSDLTTFSSLSLSRRTSSGTVTPA